MIADALAEIHGAKVMHKDINPSNILYNPLTKQLKIIDFGISAPLSLENPDIETRRSSKALYHTSRPNRPAG